MGNTCGCNQESLIQEQHSEVDLSIKEKPTHQAEHRPQESTCAEDWQSLDQQSQAQYTDVKSAISPTHSMMPSQTAESLFATESDRRQVYDYALVEQPIEGLTTDGKADEKPEAVINRHVEVLDYVIAEDYNQATEQVESTKKEEADRESARYKAIAKLELLIQQDEEEKDTNKQSSMGLRPAVSRQSTFSTSSKNSKKNKKKKNKK